MVATRGRNGTVVTGADEARAVDAAADYAATVRGLGLPAERALEIVKGMLETGPA